GILLYEGIGDTIRVSVSGPPQDEMIIAQKLLKSTGLMDNVPELIACPTCGRIQYNMIPIVEAMEDWLRTIDKDISVAVMGCPVHGIQEASRADIGVAGGYDSAILFRKGQIIRTVPQAEILEALQEEIRKML
ncbi:MAG: flavodoxin-dependent (E)-4-hydroxy-3-methylbut-2-enyl-diphosphate synthase, partial [Solobacterium sp.]|nr:flavodoxin-dependent (E)-4-hydroxy-3-methylbut-2-enyl-diphosphate synthase [Solobacterium sp.]